MDLDDQIKSISEIKHYKGYHTLSKKIINQNKDDKKRVINSIKQKMAREFIYNLPDEFIDIDEHSDLYNIFIKMELCVIKKSKLNEILTDLINKQAFKIAEILNNRDMNFLQMDKIFFKGDKKNDKSE